MALRTGSKIVVAYDTLLSEADHETVADRLPVPRARDRVRERLARAHGGHGRSARSGRVQVSLTTPAGTSAAAGASGAASRTPRVRRRVGLLDCSKQLLRLSYDQQYRACHGFQFLSDGHAIRALLYATHTRDRHSDVAPGARECHHRHCARFDFDPRAVLLPLAPRKDHRRTRLRLRAGTLLSAWCGIRAMARGSTTLSPCCGRPAAAVCEQRSLARHHVAPIPVWPT
jgi:hypothetical protein